MDLKTLNRIDKLRRLKSRGPQTPRWLKSYYVLLIAFALIVAWGLYQNLMLKLLL